MSNDLQLTTSKILPAETRPAVFTQTGDKNTQIAHANSVNQVINIIVPGMAQQPGGTMNACVALNLDCYNLFVIGAEDFQGGHFIVPKDRALTESMADETKKQFLERAQALLKSALGVELTASLMTDGWYDG